MEMKTVTCEPRRALLMACSKFWGLGFCKYTARIEGTMIRMVARQTARRVNQKLSQCQVLEKEVPAFLGIPRCACFLIFEFLSNYLKPGFR